MKIYLWKLEWMTEPDTDSEKPRKIKGDLVIYMSLYNWKPSYEDHDYFMKGNYLQLNLTKVQKTDYLFLAFQSVKGCQILFQYCFEKEPPDHWIVPPNKGLDLNAIWR